MSKKSKPIKDASIIAASYIAADHLDEYANSAMAAADAFDVFTSTSEEITKNINGGAGFFAEAHHAASFNSNQMQAGLDGRAERLGSHEYASVDIKTTMGDEFNPKYYATANESYHAGAEVVIDVNGDLAAKYAGQTIVVPADQLNFVISQHESSIQEAIAVNDYQRAEALKTINFSDVVIGDNGVSSSPLTYAEAQQGTDAMRHGGLPEFAHESSFFDSASTVGEGALTAIAFTTVIDIAPTLLAGFKSVAAGEMNLSDVSNQVLSKIQSETTINKIKGTTLKATAAGGLAMLDGVDSTGATFLVIYGFTLWELTKKLNAGEITVNDFFIEAGKSGIEKAALVGITHAAVTLAGPIGLLAPIMAQHIIQNDKISKQIEVGLAELFEARFDIAKMQVDTLGFYSYSAQRAVMSRQHMESALYNAETHKKTNTDIINLIEESNQQDKLRVAKLLSRKKA